MDRQGLPHHSLQPVFAMAATPMPASELGYVPWTKKLCTNSKAYDDGVSNCDKRARISCNECGLVRVRHQLFYVKSRISTCLLYDSIAPRTAATSIAPITSQIAIPLYALRLGCLHLRWKNAKPTVSFPLSLKRISSNYGAICPHLTLLNSAITKASIMAGISHCTHHVILLHAH